MRRRRVGRAPLDHVLPEHGLVEGRADEDERRVLEVERELLVRRLAIAQARRVLQGREGHVVDVVTDHAVQVDDLDRSVGGRPRVGAVHGERRHADEPVRQLAAARDRGLDVVDVERVDAPPGRRQPRGDVPRHVVGDREPLVEIAPDRVAVALECHVEEVGERAAVVRLGAEQLLPQLGAHLLGGRQRPARAIAHPAREPGAGEQDRLARRRGVEQLGQLARARMHHRAVMPSSCHAARGTGHDPCIGSRS